MPSYERQHEAGLAVYLARLPAIASLLGGPPGAWKISEIGDGNLNLVFLVESPRSSVIVKQALPYVRMVGESWPLPISRSHFEHLALRGYEELCPGLSPVVYHHDPHFALTVMEHLRPHIVMRRGLAAGSTYPGFADAISTFLARSLFFTSDLGRSADHKRESLAAFAGNFAMCKISEDLIFTEPYHAAANNRWTSPQLDAVAASLTRDAELILHAARLKYLFLTHTEATIHGDLHTGSIMVSASDTRVIDPEFACSGPMAFDVGMLLGNLLMAYCAQGGLESSPSVRAPYRRWVLAAVEAVWQGFHDKFIALWRTENAGDAFCPSVFGQDDLLAALNEEQKHFMRRVFHEALGFAGLEMIRRIVGLSHVVDFELIADADIRARCESSALALARRLVVHAANFESIDAVTSFASDCVASGQSAGL